MLKLETLTCKLVLYTCNLICLKVTKTKYTVFYINHAGRRCTYSKYYLKQHLENTNLVALQYSILIK